MKVLHGSSNKILKQQFIAKLEAIGRIITSILSGYKDLLQSKLDSICFMKIKRLQNMKRLMKWLQNPLISIIRELQNKANYIDII